MSKLAITAADLKVGDVFRSVAHPNYTLKVEAVEHDVHIGSDPEPWVRYVARDFHKTWTRSLPADYRVTVEEVMSTLIDNTGVEKLVDVAGIVWVETKFSSYTARRSADGRFYVGETPKRFYRLSDNLRDVGIAFATAKDAQAYAATLSEVAA